MRFMPRSNSSTSAEATSVSSSHSHTSHDDTAAPTQAGPTEAPRDLTPPSGSPTPTPTPYATPLSHTPTSDTSIPDESTCITPTPNTITADTSTTNTPTLGTPVRHTPTSHTPTTFIPSAHTPTPHAPTPHTPTLYTLTGYASTPHTPATYTPTSHTPPACAPNGCATAPYYPKVPISTPNPALTLPTLKAAPLYPTNQSRGSESPALPQSTLSMKPRVLSTGASKRSSPTPKVPKMDALAKQWPQTENSAPLSSFLPRLLEAVMDTVDQSNPTTAAGGAGQSGISSYFSLDRGLQLQRAAFSTQVQHTGTAPPSPATKEAASKGSTSPSALESEVSLRPMAAMAGVAQKIGDGKPSTTSSPSKSTSPPVGSDKLTTAPPAGKETGPVRPSALSLAFNSFRMRS